MPLTLGNFTTINNLNKGKPLTKPCKFLDKVHLDIVYGKCLCLGSFQYAMLLVDVATPYCWVFSLATLTNAEIIAAFEDFCATAGGLPKKFHTDFDQKLIGGGTLHWINTDKSKIIAAPHGHQSANGLVERTWQTILWMAHSYITEKQVGREYWFIAIKYSAHMPKMVPGCPSCQLILPFELVYGEKLDSTTWFELFPVGYFPMPVKSGESASASQAQTMDGIAVGHDDTSNTITFYNPLTHKYYHPPAFKLDKSHLPVMVYPKNIHFDGGVAFSTTILIPSLNLFLPTQESTLPLAVK
jgi:hypothetical protein